MSMYRLFRPSPQNVLAVFLLLCFLLLLLTVLQSPKQANHSPNRRANRAASWHLDPNRDAQNQGRLKHYYLKQYRPNKGENNHKIGHNRDVLKFLMRDKNPSTKFPLRAWRRRKQWTTPPTIYTTEFSYVTMKYYTYIEDFLANYDKYTLVSAERKRIKDVLEAANRLKNRKLFTPALTESQRSLVYDLLSSFDNLAKKEGIRYFMYGGTVLGSFRHHDLVPYDDDVDLIVHDDDREKLRKAVEKSETTFAMSTLSPDHFKLHNKYGTFTNLYHDWTYPYIDLSFYRTNETHLYDLALTYGRWWAYETDTIMPLHNRPLGPLMLPAPRDSLKYLKETYKDLKQCSESYYSHQLEMVVRCRQIATECSTLPYAFVHRSLPSSGQGVNETVVQDGKVLSWKVVDEPEYQAEIKDPYTLT